MHLSRRGFMATVPIELTAELAAKRDQLLASLATLSSVAVAFSGGVDSAVVAKAAQLSLGDAAVAVTGVSPSLASGELEIAIEVASAIGIRHEIMRTDELGSEGYVRNAGDRCYFCKTELYTQLESRLAALDVEAIVNGANVDDLGDHRPGMKAASEHRVRSPLAEAGLTKAEVRELARYWNLSVSDKPATPCLSSRLAYGVQVTPERLRMIDEAEVWLKEQGIANCRVRLHEGMIARLEVPVSDLARVASSPLRETLAAEFKRLGFRFVTLDLEGFRSGSLNQLLTIELVK